jgi:hypothetical protein
MRQIMKPHVRMVGLLGPVLLAAAVAQAQPGPGQSAPRQTTPSPTPPKAPAPAKPAPATPEKVLSARELFELHDLIGTFAIDCSRPVGPRNPQAVYLAQGDGTVEFSLMIGPNRRRFSYTIDWAEEIVPGEVSFSMTNDETRINVVYLLDGGAIRAMESSREADGERLITKGMSASNLETQWFYKCK